MFREDDNIQDALTNIYTSSFIRYFKKDVPSLLEKNDFIGNIYNQDIERSVISHYVPKVDYDQLIYSNGTNYEISSQSDYYNKMIVYNVVNYNFKDIVVGIRYKFKY
ncbi:MAG: hypothetical protein QXF12_00100 [Candidatus Aenigmatarchaeota archaeon]